MTRPIIYATVAAAVAGAMAYVSTSPIADAPRPPPHVASPSVDPKASTLPPTLPSRAAIGQRRSELFAFSAPPVAQPMAKSEPVPALPAPVLPFRFAGVITYDGRVEHVLAKGERLFVVKSGDVLDDGYRVEALSHDEITLVYVPLGLHMPLSASSFPAPPGAQIPQQRADAANILGLPAASVLLPSASDPGLAVSARDLHIRDPRSLFQRRSRTN